MRWTHLFRSTLVPLGLIACTLVPPAAVAQAPTARVTGSVSNDASGEPIPGAFVSVEGVPGGAVTGMDGRFQISGVPSGSRALEVESFGFATVRRTVTVPESGEIEVEVLLEESAIEVDPVVVTATLDRRAGAEALRPTEVLGGRDLQRRLAPTIAETLAGEPGVAVASMGPGSARPVIRGFGGDRILMLEDGQRIGDVSSTSADHAVASEGASARQIEVVRGPAALFYGSNALGGVVNVVREEIPREPVAGATGAVGLQGQSVHRSASGSAELAVPIGGFVARAEATARSSGDTRTPDEVLANSDIRSWAGAAALSRVGDRGHAGLGVRVHTSDYGIPPDSVSGHPSGVAIELDRLSVRGSTELLWDLGPFEHLQADGGLTTYEHVEVESSGEVGTAFDQTSYYLEVEGHHEEAGPFASGGLGIRAEVRDYFSDNGRDEVETRETTFSVFGLEEWRSGDLAIQGGLRFDHREVEPRIPITIRGVEARRRTFEALAGSLAGLYEVAEDVRVGVSLARSVRTPSTEELFSQGPHLAAYTFEVGNPELEMETGLGFDAFVRVNRPRLRAEVVGFTSAIENFSYTENTGEQRGALYVYRYANTRARYSGAEASLEWSPGAGWALGGNASWVRATDTELDEPLPLIPPLQGRLFARYERESWFVGAAVRWAGRQDRVPERPELPPNAPGYCDRPGAGDICRPVPGEFLPTDGYAVLGGSLGYRWIRDRTIHSVTLRVENATDATYRNHLSRLKELVAEPGFGLSLLYRLTF